jgi:hypothetical protein
MVRGLRLFVTEEQVKAVFFPHGKITSIKLITDNKNQQTKLAYVNYATGERKKNPFH